MTINFLIIMLLILQLSMPLNYFNFKKNELIINTVNIVHLILNWK